MKKFKLLIASLLVFTFIGSYSEAQAQRGGTRNNGNQGYGYNQNRGNQGYGYNQNRGNQGYYDRDHHHNHHYQDQNYRYNRNNGYYYRSYPNGRNRYNPYSHYNRPSCCDGHHNAQCGHNPPPRPRVVVIHR